MRSNRFTTIRDRFLPYFEREVERLNTDFADLSCNCEVHFPPENVTYGYFSMYISCLLTGAEFEGSDNIALGICIFDQKDYLEFDCHVSWGHPSGTIVAEISEERVPVTTESLKAIEEQLPSMVFKMRAAIAMAQRIG